MLNEQITFKNPNRPVIIAQQELTFAWPMSNLHFHNEIELLYIERGDLLCEIGEISITFKEGDIIFIDSFVPHSTTCFDEGIRLKMLQFRKPSVLKSPTPYMSSFFKRANSLFYVFAKNDPCYEDLKTAINKIFEENKSSDISSDYFITSNVYTLLGLLHKKDILAEETHSINLDKLQKLLPVFEFIDTNFAEELSLDLLAESLNINKHYLCRLFKLATGKTITDYINFVRTEKAIDFLKNGISVTETSYKAGFASVTYFEQIFKKYKFCSPTAYKKLLMYEPLSIITSTDN